MIRGTPRLKTPLRIPNLSLNLKFCRSAERIVKTTGSLRGAVIRNPPSSSNTQSHFFHSPLVSTGNTLPLLHASQVRKAKAHERGRSPSIAISMHATGHVDNTMKPGLRHLLTFGVSSGSSSVRGSDSGSASSASFSASLFQCPSARHAVVCSSSTRKKLLTKMARHPMRRFVKH